MAIKPIVKPTKATPVMAGNLKALAPRLGKKQVLYGPPATGKTSCLKGLVANGWDLVYLDADGNFEPLLEIPPEHQSQVTYIPLRNNSSNPTRHKALIELSDKGILTWCTDHGFHACPHCSADQFNVWDSKDVDWSKTIFVLDSYTQIHASCTAAAYHEHGLGDAAKLEIPHFGTVSRLNVRAVDWILNNAHNAIIITHRGNKRGITEKGADKYYPILGSQNMSGNVPALVNSLWYITSYATPPIMSKPVDGSVEAFTRGGSEKFSKMRPLEAVAAYFGKPHNI